MVINRHIVKKLLQLKTKFPVITVTGPRQSGKTTLIKTANTELPYVTIEDPDVLQVAKTDPRGFLANYPKGAIIDEVQNLPELFSYIQGIVDSTDAQFILSGSQNFLLLENISQSLAGRAAILKLLPFSISELRQTEFIFEKPHDLIFKGFYPRIYDKNIAPTDFYPSYINTYIERDVRQIQNVENLNVFTRFIKLCAGRIGSPLNTQSLASDTGISPNTAKAWLSILEASYIVYFLQPHYKNFNKRLIKSPKLYFYDTGVACSLLGLDNAEQLQTHYLIGSLFENFIINELLKKSYNNGETPAFYYWKNKHGKEIDLIIDKAEHSYPYEIKAGATLNQSYFSNLKYWQGLTNEKSENLNVIFAGDNNFRTSNGNFISWKNITELNI